MHGVLQRMGGGAPAMSAHWMALLVSMMSLQTVFTVAASSLRMESGMLPSACASSACAASLYGDSSSPPAAQPPSIPQSFENQPLMVLLATLAFNAASGGWGERREGASGYRKEGPAEQKRGLRGPKPSKKHACPAGHWPFHPTLINLLLSCDVCYPLACSTGL